MNKSMKKVLSSSVVALAMLTLCSCMHVHWSKNKSALAEEQRPLSGFERIELLGSLDVKYQQADSFSVLVKAPAKVMEDVETRLEGNKLVVNMKFDGELINFGVADSDDVTVYVTSPDFLGITLKGSGDFECKYPLDTDTLDINLKGSGDIEFGDIICDRVNVSLTGSGDVEVKTVKTRNSRVSLVGSGDVKMRFDDSGPVESNLTGSGDITLMGTVSECKSNVRGSGEIHTDKLRINN